MKSTIDSIRAYEVLDSRGNPTITVDLTLKSGHTGRAPVPSGASTGSHEVVEKRDNDSKRYNGLGVLSVCREVNTYIHSALKGMYIEQRELDMILHDLDGTQTFSHIGSQSALGISLAFCRAQAKENNTELYQFISDNYNKSAINIPLCFFNIINGGKHADSGLSFQEFMIVSRTTSSISKQLQHASATIQSLTSILKTQNKSIGIGDEGGFAPHLAHNKEALTLLTEAITLSGDTMNIALDCAANEYYNKSTDTYNVEQAMTSEEITQYYKEIVASYPIVSIEDPYHEEALNEFAHLNTFYNNSVEIVGDDITTTNIHRIKEAYNNKSLSSVIIKPNQIGTFSETIDAITLTKSYGWKPFISHRSGETNDTFIADLAVGMACPYIKSGSLKRGERIAKYNRLLEIERALQS